LKWEEFFLALAFLAGNLMMTIRLLIIELFII
jgi:hypothetical protein